MIIFPRIKFSRAYSIFYIACTVLFCVLIIADSIALRKPDDKAIAQYNAGTMYCEYKGGVEQDYKQAFHWHKKAANQCYAEAEFALSNLHKN